MAQVVEPLPGGASLKLTVAKYYTPSGRCIQARCAPEMRPRCGRDVTETRSCQAVSYTPKNGAKSATIKATDAKTDAPTAPTDGAAPAAPDAPNAPAPAPAPPRTPKKEKGRVPMSDRGGDGVRAVPVDESARKSFKTLNGREVRSCADVSCCGGALAVVVMAHAVVSA